MPNSKIELSYFPKIPSEILYCTFRANSTKSWPLLQTMLIFRETGVCGHLSTYYGRNPLLCLSMLCLFLMYFLLSLFVSFFVMFLCEQSILLPYLHMKPDLLIDFSFFKLPASSCVWLIVFDCYLWFIFLSAIAIFSIITTLNCNILYCCTIVLLLLHVYKRYLKVGSRSGRMGLNGTCAKGETQLCF